MKKQTCIIIGITIVFFISVACVWISVKTKFIGEEEPTRTPTANCLPLPDNFKESNLIGTWMAEYTFDTDTIMLKEDGTYKQIYDNPKAGFYYESGWQTWWVEYRDVGYLWLHMEGMRRCDDLPEVCNQKGGGTERRTIDYCENIDVPEQGEVILVVTGANFETPRGIELRQTRLAGRDWSYSFVLQQEDEK